MSSVFHPIFTFYAVRLSDKCMEKQWFRSKTACLRNNFTQHLLLLVGYSILPNYYYISRTLSLTIFLYHPPPPSVYISSHTCSGFMEPPIKNHIYPFLSSGGSCVMNREITLLPPCALGPS